MTECPNCKRTFAVPTDVCGGCGHRLDAPTADGAPTAAMTTTATVERAPATQGSWASTPLSATTTWHRVPQAGVQTYVEPELDSDPAQFVPGGAQVGVVATREDGWAQIVYGGTTTWVDGRGLNPPLFGTAPASTAPGTTRTSRTSPTSSSRKLDPWSVISAVASVGLIVGAFVPWVRGAIGWNSFDFPMQSLFDKRAAFDAQPRIGYVLVVFGLTAVFASLSSDLTWLRRLVGVLSIVIAGLFFFQIQDSIVFSNINASDIVSVGPWVVGVCGLALAVLPRPRA